jgi:hypothetical protein
MPDDYCRGAAPSAPGGAAVKENAAAAPQRHGGCFWKRTAQSHEKNKKTPGVIEMESAWNQLANCMSIIKHVKTRSCIMIGEQKRYTAQYNQLMVYVTQTQQGDFRGVIHHPGLELTWTFDNFIHLVQRGERAFNALNYPSPAYRLRDLTNSKKSRRREELDLKEDAISFVPEPEEQPTFIIKVLYRQNACWQGSIQWVEKGVKKNFRSTLELLKLMDQAVNEGHNDISWE